MTLMLAACAHAGFERPPEIRFGASAASLQHALAGRCTQQRLRRFGPPFLSNVRDRQMQIDCEGYPFMGAGRHVEFVIRDDKLVMVWLMVRDEETQAMIEAMTDAYGPPSRRNGDYVAFERRRAAWRNHPAEILFWATELDADLDENFR